MRNYGHSENRAEHVTRREQSEGLAEAQKQAKEIWTREGMHDGMTPEQEAQEQARAALPQQVEGMLPMERKGGNDLRETEETVSSDRIPDKKREAWKTPLQDFIEGFKSDE